MGEATNKSGFFVSQIGAKNSPERTRADEVYKYIVKPACAKFGINITRSDLESKPGPVTHQIIKSLTTADVVIADVTGRNPNVNYELGVAHSFGQPLVILVDSSKSLPFDTQNERVIEIGDDGEIGAAKAEAAEAALSLALEVVMADTYVPENVVTSAASTQSLDALAPDDPIATELAGLRESMDQFELHLKMIRRSTSSKPKERVSLRLLKEFIELAVGEGGAFTADDLERRLITPRSPEEWDSWVQKMSLRMQILAVPTLEGLEPRTKRSVSEDEKDGRVF